MACEWATTYVSSNTTYYLRIKQVRFISDVEATIFLGAGGHTDIETPIGDEQIKIIKFNFNTKAVTTLADSITKQFWIPKDDKCGMVIKYRNSSYDRISGWI